MNVIRIPTKFARSIKRLSDKDRLLVFDSLLKIGENEVIKLPDSAAWDLVELIYWEWMNMESRNWEYWTNWKWGITKETQKIRNSKEYKEWRKSVFERDNFTCIKCKTIGWILNAHHIEHFSKNKDLRFDIDNWITLCKDCHINIHKK